VRKKAWNYEKRCLPWSPSGRPAASQRSIFGRQVHRVVKTQLPVRQIQRPTSKSKTTRSLQCGWFPWAAA